MSENGKKPRRQFTADLKYQILREARQTGTRSARCAPSTTSGRPCSTSGSRRPNAARKRLWAPSPAGRVAAAARSRDRAQRREPAAQQGTLTLTAGRRYTADEKAVILKPVQQAQAHCPEWPLEAILGDLGLPAATYFRWVARAASGTLADQVVVPTRPAVPPTPAEVEAVTGYAHAHRCWATSGWRTR